MRSGVVLFVLIFGGFVGFEMYAASRNSYRMEPGHIYGQFVGAAHAVDVCNADKASRRQKFERNVAYARRRARDALATEFPERTAAAIDAELAEQTGRIHLEVEALIDDNGCDDIEVWKLLKRYDVLTRQNPPGA